MATIWQTSGDTTPLRGLSPISLPVKVIVSVFFSIGVFYLFLILTTFAHYGDIDEAWHKRIKEHIKTPATTNRLYDQTYAWGTNPYPAVPEQPLGAPGLSYAQYPTVGPPLHIPVVPPPFLGPQYQQPYPMPLQSPGGPLQPQYTSRSVTPVSLSHITPFIPDRPLSPTASYRAPPYDNRYLSPRLSTHSPQSINRNLYSIAEGEGQEPSSPSFHRGRGPPVPSQPQRQFSNNTRSSSESHDISRRSQGIRLMPMAFPPDNTSITIEPPQLPSSDSADNLDILERDEMPRQHQHHAWTDQGQPDEVLPPSAPTLLPPTRLTTSLSPPPTYNDIPSSLGFVGGGGSLSPGTLLDPSPGGSRRSSRRPTPSPHRTDRHDPRTTQSQSQNQDRNYRSSDRLRPPDLPPPSAAPDIITRSISLPVALERHTTTGYDLGGPSTAPTSATATTATATPTATTATATTKEQAQPPDSAPAAAPLQSSRPTPLTSPIPLPPHVSPPPPNGPDLPNLGPSLFIDVVDADADPGGHPNSNSGSNSNSNTNAKSNASTNSNSNANSKSSASTNTNPYGEDDVESRSTVSSLELYSITPSRSRGAGGGAGGAGGGGGGSGSGSEGVSLHTARGQFDSGSGSSDEE
jgi:hypothetical protein